MRGTTVHVSRIADHAGAFFKILHTTQRTQTALMTLEAGQEAGPPETHPESDQVFHIVQGAARMRTWEGGDDAAAREHEAAAGMVVVVPAGVRHWVQSVGDGPLVFLTVYGPPEY